MYSTLLDDRSLLNSTAAEIKHYCLGYRYSLICTELLSTFDVYLFFHISDQHQPKSGTLVQLLVLLFDFAELSLGIVGQFVRLSVASDSISLTEEKPVNIDVSFGIRLMALPHSY